jgi:hypothetical protein
MRAALLVGVSALALAQVACGDDSACEDASCASSGDTASSSAASSSASSSGAGTGGSAPSLECPASGVLRGPWAQKPRPTSITLRWDACAETDATAIVSIDGEDRSIAGTQTAAEVRTEYMGLEGVTLPDFAGTYWLNEVVVEDLEPGSCHEYAIAADPERGGRFCTSRPSGDAFSFWAIGDTNPGIAPTEAVVEHIVARGPDFVLHEGDIQYYSSIVDSWTQWFISMQPMLSSGVFAPTYGNHEAELEHELEDYYLRMFADGGDGTAPTWYRFESGGLHVFVIDTEGDIAIGSEQGGWLEAGLADAATSEGFRGSLVTMHRPLISVGDVASRPELRAHYEPIFVEHGVRLVLAGHMHGYERFVSSGIVYITTGGGGGALGDVDENVDLDPAETSLRLAAARAFHAVLFEVGDDAITGSAIDETGETFDSFAVDLPPG